MEKKLRQISRFRTSRKQLRFIVMCLGLNWKWQYRKIKVALSRNWERKRSKRTGNNLVWNAGFLYQRLQWLHFRIYRKGRTLRLLRNLALRVI